MKRFLSFFIVFTVVLLPLLSFEKKWEEVDREIYTLMEECHVPGAALVVVKEGEVLYKKGYGLASIEKNISVDPDKSIFQLNSITKIFTAISILQLVERNKISLDDTLDKFFFDCGNPTLNNPEIKIRHLLCHTSGLDTRFLDQMGDSYSEPLMELSDVLENIPDIIRSPGQIMSYSNWGFTVLGRVVEISTGKSIDAYIEQNLFKPLNMESSFYAYRPEIDGHLAQGYLYKKGQLLPRGPVPYKIHPAGFSFSSAGDMGKFISFLLSGRDDVLSKSSLESMLKTQFTYNKEMLGNGLAFFERKRARIRTPSTRPLG